MHVQVVAEVISLFIRHPGRNRGLWKCGKQSALVVTYFPNAMTKAEDNVRSLASFM